MTPLSDTQKQFLFDYCIGVTSQVENAQAQELIFSNEEAGRFVTQIKASLSPLDKLTDEKCPDELAEGTIWRSIQAVRTSKLQLNQLIAAEQRKRTSTWRELFGRLATAAVFVIVGSTLITGGRAGINYARQKSWQTQCGAQLAGLFTGLSNYKADNDGQLPILAVTPGMSWHRVGYQGPENVSNTRRMWILVRNEYVQPDDFMCPATKSKCSVPCNPRKLNDFPERKLVTYSFRISCPTPAGVETGRRVIISDLSPVFENILCNGKPLDINLNDFPELLKRNSSNHKGRGQNVLFSDGSVQFIKQRYVDVSLDQDDIFTIRDKQTYTGTELPASEADAFLAP